MTSSTPSSAPSSDAGGTERVRLSVVVTIVDGEEALRRCLEALEAQESPPSLEVLVPYDASVPWAERVARDHPGFRFLQMGDVPTERPPASPAGQHELYDRRRAAGLAVASGELVGILEDRGVPDPDWATTVDRLHRELPHAVIGGAVECGVDAPLAWAVYFCDFGRYQLPLTPGPKAWVTDVNIAYKRGALERTEDLWRDRYHETTVHWALARAGETLYLSPELVVRQMRTELRPGRVLHERYDWGRLFAYTRARESSLIRRFLLAALSPALPFVLLGRHLRTQTEKRVHLGRFLRLAILVLMLLAAWSLGELVGYVSGRA